MQRTLTVLPYAVRLSVDEHRTQRVGDGADVAAQQLGDRQADVGTVYNCALYSKGFWTLLRS